MNTRMQRYTNDEPISGRTEKNKRLYDKVQDMNIDYIDIDVNNAVELDINNRIPRTRSDYQLRKELGGIMPRESSSLNKTFVEEPTIKEEKVYDINEILKLARENKLFQDDSHKKRLINTEYNLLTKLDIEALEKQDVYSKESLRKLIDDIYEKEQPKEIKSTKRRSRVEESDLFDDLKPTDFELSAALSGKILDKKEEKTKLEKTMAKELAKTNTIYRKIDEKTLNEYKTQELNKTNASIKAEETNTDTLDLTEEFKTSKGVLVFTIIVVLVLLAISGYVFYKFFMVK